MGTINETKLSNRRRSRREKTRSSVKVQCRKDALGMGPNLTSKVLDISDSGVRMVINESLDPMSEVEILIDGYGMKGPIKRVGNIRWLVTLDTGEFCVGIEFQKALNYREWLNLASPS